MSAIHQAASEFGLQPAVDDKGALVFQCVQCFAVLKSPRRSNWSDHQKTHQKDRQRFPCTAKDCDATFYRLGDWRRHIKFHQGERSFECTSCGKAFGRHDHLTRHEASGCPRSRLRPLVLPPSESSTEARAPDPPIDVDAEVTDIDVNDAELTQLIEGVGQDWLERFIVELQNWHNSNEPSIEAPPEPQSQPAQELTPPPSPRMLGAQCTTQTSTSHPTSTTARTHLQPPLPSRRHSRPPPAPPPPTPAPNHVDTDSRSPLDARFPPHGEDVWLTPPVPSQPWVPATPAPRVDPTVDVDELLQVFSGTGALATTGEVQFGLWERSFSF